MSGGVPVPGEVPSGHVLESERRLSESIIWELNRRYYEAQGPRAWSSGDVPFYITSNPFIAHAYAQVVRGFLADLRGAGALDLGQPLYIVELAAGHGRFTFLLLSQLLRLRGCPELHGLDLRYVMTDLAESNLAAWEERRELERFRTAGLLYSARLDAARPAEITLRPSGTVLRAGALRNPLIVVANYVLDSLPVDLLRLARGQLQEGLVTTRCPEAEALRLAAGEAPREMASLATTFSYRALSGDAYPRAWHALFEEYRALIADGEVLFPVGALSCLAHLHELSSGRLLMLASDKGVAFGDELLGPHGAPLQHHGSLSTMVNFHALGRAVEQSGGAALHTSQRHLSLKTTALVVLPPAEAGPVPLPGLRSAFAEHLDGFGPHDFYQVISAQRGRELDLPAALALLRLSRDDGDLFCELAERLVTMAAGASDALRLELLSALRRVRENFYPLGSDVPFALARVYLVLGRPREALRCIDESVRAFGEHAAIACNAGICHYHSEDPQQAERAFLRALELDPAHAPSRLWLARLRAELSPRGGLPAGALPPPSSEVTQRP